MATIFIAFLIEVFFHPSVIGALCDHGLDFVNEDSNNSDILIVVAVKKSVQVFHRHKHISYLKQRVSVKHV